MYEVNSKRNKNNKKNWNEWVEKGGKMHFCPACFFLVVIFHSWYEMRKISSMRNRSDTHAQRRRRRRRWYYRPGARTPQHKRDRAHSHQVQRFNAKTLCIRTDTMVVKCPYRQQLVRLHFSHWHSRITQHQAGRQLKWRNRQLQLYMLAHHRGDSYPSVQSAVCRFFFSSSTLLDALVLYAGWTSFVSVRVRRRAHTNRLCGMS